MLGVHPGAEPADGLPVHLDPARADQLLAVPAAAHARRGEHLLQPDPAGDVGEVVPLTAEIAAVVVLVVVEAHAAQCPEPASPPATAA